MFFLHRKIETSTFCGAWPDLPDLPEANGSKRKQTEILIINFNKFFFCWNICIWTMHFIVSIFCYFFRRISLCFFFISCNYVFFSVYNITSTSNKFVIPRGYILIWSNTSYYIFSFFKIEFDWFIVLYNKSILNCQFIVKFLLEISPHRIL